MSLTDPTTDYRSKERTPVFSLMQFCVRCMGKVWVRPEMEGKPVSCSKACDRKLHRERMAEERRSALTTVEGHTPLTPYEASRLRSHIFQCVAEQIEVAHAFVMGRPTDPFAPEGAPGSAPPKLNAQQVRIFTALLNKVVPDLNHSFTESADRNIEVSELSRDELERIVASAGTSAKLIDGTP